ncbi:MAG: polysaccharide deacetylase family protein [Calditrichaeota bacterium]|nr:polysaccharide deacetylase family protein [Calditrichota bacterium]
MTFSKKTYHNIYILTYHHVCSEWLPSAARVTPEQFKMHIQILKSLGVHFFSLNDLIDLPENSPQKRVAITFDDGFSCLYKHAFPVLEEEKIPATIFLVTDFIGKKSTWDVNFGIHRARHLSWSEIIEMKKYGISFGSHTHRHIDLAGSSQNQIREDLKRSKSLLEDELGEFLHLLAYPFGRSSQRAKDVLRELNFRAAFSLYPDSQFSDVLQIPRYGVYLFDHKHFLKAKMDENWLAPIEKSKLKIINFLSVGTILTKKITQEKNS